jgi:hypothetical protein
MTRLYKLGGHTFYRPRAWGDGDDEPKWGPMPSTGKADAAVKPEADATPAKPAATAVATLQL